jgi:hypothetical protein
MNDLSLLSTIQQPKHEVNVLGVECSEVEHFKFLIFRKC